MCKARPYNPDTGKMDYVSLANYATCFREVYNAIKAVRPNNKVLPEAPAAGKDTSGVTNPAPQSVYHQPDHPHACEEDMPRQMVCTGTGGPSPRVWGRPASL